MKDGASSGGGKINPSPYVPGGAGFRLGIDLHIGQHLLLNLELLAQMIRFQRSPDEIGKA